MFLRWLHDVRHKLITARQGSRHRAQGRKQTARELGVEALEERTVPATVSWINPAGGDWATAANWSTGAVPGTGDDVLLNLPGSVTVTHTGNVTDTVNSLSNSDILAMSAGILNAQTIQNAGTITVGSLAMLATNTYTQTAGATLLQGGKLGAFQPPESTALSFNGSDYAQAPSSPSLEPTSQMTVEAWVNPSSLANPLQGIAGTWNDQQGNNRTDLLWIQFNHFAFYVSHDGMDFPDAVSSTTVQAGQWYHVAGTFDGTYLRLYVNGALEATTYSPGPIDTNVLPFTIGQVNGGGAGPELFQGQIADLSFWTVARTQSQVQSDMAQPLSGPQTGLAAYWPLDAVSSTGTVADLSGNQNATTTSDPALTAMPVSGGTVDIQGGTFSGFGTVTGDLTNAGEVDLSGAAGTLTVRGNYTQTAAGILGLAVGSPFDPFAVSGSATLDGTLNVSLTNGFNPLQGQTIDAVNFGSVSGNFAAVNLPTSDGVTAFTTDLAATDLTLVGATVPPTSTVNPLPANSPPSFTVSWTGQDNPGGSGVASYDLYVSDNGAAFVPFVTGTAATSATFTGQKGHTYSFYSVATDAIGNRQATPSGAEATTTVPQQVSTSTSLTSSAPTGSTYGQGVTFTASVTPGLSVFGTPTGSVQFLVDGVNLGSPVSLTNGVASITTTALTAGQRNITADYTGDTDDFGASNGALAQTVAPAPLTITANSTNKTYGTTTTFAGTEFVIGGLVNGDTVTSTTLTSAGAAATAGVGSYAIVPSAAVGTGLGNYTIGYTNGTLTVTAAPLSATGVNLSATAGAPFNGVVATFTNADPFGSAASYSAVIAWGDGSTSMGTITGTGILTVSGTHTYADPLNETVQVTITHNLGYTTPATTTGTAFLTNLGFGPTQDLDYWRDRDQGQALIQSFNGGPTATALSTWLATTYPQLFGAQAAANNLTGKTNAEVAAFLTNENDSSEAVQQVLATALNVYATTWSLGGAAGETAGFQVTLGGLGANSYNVGTDGAAFGVADNTSLTVTQLLASVNNQAVGGVPYNGNHQLRRQANDLLRTVNQDGQAGIQNDQTADADFWHHSRGQALLASFNGGPTATALSTWLATTFSNLYGASAGSHNLTGKTNAQVAAFFQTLWSQPNANVDVQVLATALNVYATTASLGGAQGQTHDFDVTAEGLGAVDVWHAGATGSVNDMTLNVFELLQGVNQWAVNGVVFDGDHNLRDVAADLFERLNGAGA